MYIGTLSSADQQSPFAVAAAADQSGVAVVPEPGPGQPSSLPAATTTTATAAANGPPARSNTTPAEDVPWVPSGGRKLETGLSIVLENVASGFTRPNVLDVKLGARLWGDDAPPAKRAKLDAVSRETTSGNLGFRIAGMKVWTGVNGETDAGSRTDPYEIKHEGSEGARGEVIEKDGYRRYDKWYGRSFKDLNVKEGFETFLAGAKPGTDNRSKLVARRLAEELKRVQRVLEEEESRMYSSSVLIVYEGDPEALDHALEEEKKAAENPPVKKEQDDEEDEDEDEEFDLQDGSFEVVDLKLGGDNALPQKAININIDPEAAQMAGLGEGVNDDDDDEEEEPPKVHDLRLIDFAHARWCPGEGPDENVLTGVRNLVRIFGEIAES